MLQKTTTLTILLLITTTITTSSKQLSLPLIRNGNQLRIPISFLHSNSPKFLTFDHNLPTFFYASPPSKIPIAYTPGVDSVSSNLSVDQFELEGEELEELTEVGKGRKRFGSGMRVKGEVGFRGGLQVQGLGMLAVVAVPHGEKIEINGNLNPMQLLTSLFPNSPQASITFGSTKQLLLSDHLPSTQLSNKPMTLGVRVGNTPIATNPTIGVTFQPSQLQITLPISIAERISQHIHLGKKCQIYNDVLACRWSPTYQRVDFIFGNRLFIMEDRHYIERCEYSARHSGVMCYTYFRVSLTNERIELGQIFLEKYPVCMTSKGKYGLVPAFQQEYQYGLGYVQSIMSNNWKLRGHHTWAIAAFAALLVALKGYHIYFKALPKSSYKEFDSVIVDNQNNSSMSSNASEGDESDKDRFSEASN